MKEGNFRLSADAIVIIKGALANGQHRMWAVVECGEPQPFLLMETDDEELYKVLDCGLKRTVADAAHVSNGQGVAAIANLILAYKENRLTQHSFAKKCTRIDLITYIQANNQTLQEAYQFVRSITNKTQNLVPQSAASTLMVLGSVWHGKKPQEFLEAVYHGTNPGTITYDLRERFIKMRMAKGSVAAQYYLAILIKAFNAFVTNSKMLQIKLGESEAYPQIVKPKS